MLDLLFVVFLVAVGDESHYSGIICSLHYSEVVVSAVASQQEGPGFDTWLGQDLSVWSLDVLPGSAWVPPGFSIFLQSKDMQVD